MRIRGRASTLESLVRMAVSALCGAFVSITPFLVTKSCPTNAKAWCFLPAMPGFFIAVVTPFVGVHRDDSLLLYVTAALNTVIYGLIVFVMYPLFRRERKSA